MGGVCVGGALEGHYMYMYIIIRTCVSYVIINLFFFIFILFFFIFFFI